MHSNKPVLQCLGWVQADTTWFCFMLDAGKALEVAGDSVKAHYLLANALLNLQRLNEAEASFQVCRAQAFMTARQSFHDRQVLSCLFVAEQPPSLQSFCINNGIVLPHEFCLCLVCIPAFSSSGVSLSV